MKINAGIHTSARKHHFWGTLLIWLGVSIWVPYIALQLTGKHPSFLWYLPVHLLGVIGGSRLRSFARREMGLSPPKRRPLGIAGSVLIALGILAWVPYFYLKVIARTPVNVMDFLPFHLSGVLGGVLLLTIDSISKRKTHSE